MTFRTGFPDFDAEVTPEVLGAAFATKCAEDFTAEELAEVRRRNATPEYAGDACATHDFADANMIMLFAFEALLGREPAFLAGTDDAGNLPPESDAHTGLWNAAWSYAKAKHLTADQAQ